MSKVTNYFVRYRSKSHQFPTSLVVFELHANAFSLRDLDLGPTTLKPNRVPDILKMYRHTENEVAVDGTVQNI